MPRYIGILRSAACAMAAARGCRRDVGQGLSFLALDRVALWPKTEGWVPIILAGCVDFTKGVARVYWDSTASPTSCPWPAAPGRTRGGGRHTRRRGRRA